MAVIDVDKSQPSGLSRRFMNRGRGECLYDIEQVALFDAIEFGADYTTSLGRKQRSRWYGVVVAKTDGALNIEQCETGAKAVLRSKAARQSTADRANALKVERDAMIARATDLEREILALETPESDESQPARS
jgi:mannose/cellobiose epimerase-like protein (N-acyl-D-glucosamine 2-epimerase family)